VDGLGSLTNVNEGKFHKTTGKKLPIKVLGYGPKFFYYQMLTGDSVDSVIGVMGRGPTFAYNLLNSATTEWECYQLTAEVYVKAFGDEWETKWREMADLLWMIREIKEDAFVRWERPPMDVVVV
jgi:5'-3' exonuclease